MHFSHSGRLWELPGRTGSPVYVSLSAVDPFASHDSPHFPKPTFLASVPHYLITLPSVPTHFQVCFFHTRRAINGLPPTSTLHHIDVADTWLIELVQRAILYRHKKLSLSGLTCPLSWPKLCITLGRFFGHNFGCPQTFGLSLFVVLDIFIALRLIHTRPLEKSF